MEQEATADLVKLALDSGYSHVCVKPDAGVCGVQRFLFTHAVISGINSLFYEDRWCYRTEAEAIAALAEWNGSGDPPGAWTSNPTTNRKRHADGVVRVGW